MSRALLLTDDLLFSSNVVAALAAAGYQTELAAGEDALRQALLRAAPAIVIADLTSEELKAVQTVTELREEGLLKGVSLLGFYSHVEPAVRELALNEGFDLVVPRSRMAREAAELVRSMTSG